jgi:hypothetical protein
MASTQDLSCMQRTIESLPKDFNDLPEELLVPMFRELLPEPTYSPGKLSPDPVDYSHLIALSQVNHKCRRVAQGVLYSHVDLTHTQSQDPKRRPTRAPFKFLRTMVDSKSPTGLGNKVKYLRLLTTEQTRDFPFDDLIAGFKDRLIACVHESLYTEEQKYDWIQAIAAHNGFAALSVMFLFTPRVTVLDIGTADSSQKSGDDGFQRVAAELSRLRELNLLPNMHSLTLRSHRRCCVSSVLLEPGFGKLLQVPALKNLELVSNLKPNVPTFEPMIDRTTGAVRKWTADHIKTLTVRGFCDVDNLAFLLGHFPSLKSITYIIRPPVTLDDTAIQDMLDWILDALPRDIETIVMRCKANTDDLLEYDNAYCGFYDPLRFRGFPHLKTLELGGALRLYLDDQDYRSLSGDDKDMAIVTSMIPPSLETLLYTPDRIALDEHLGLKCLHQHFQALTPLLRRALVPFLRRASQDPQSRLKHVTVPSCLWMPLKSRLFQHELASLGIKLVRRDPAEECEEIRLIGFTNGDTLVNKLELLDDQRAEIEQQESEESEKLMHTN